MRMPGDDWFCALVLNFFNGKSLVSRSIECPPFSSGQNEIKRYKKKHAESVVFVAGMLKPDSHGEDTNFDAA